MFTSRFAQSPAYPSRRHPQRILHVVGLSMILAILLLLTNGPLGQESSSAGRNRGIAAAAGPPASVGCEFALLSFKSCIGADGLATYGIPMKNESLTWMSLNGLVILQGRGGIELSRT